MENNLAYIELGLKIVVLIGMIFTLFYSFNENTKLIQWVMSMGTTLAIFGKGIGLSLLLIGLAVYVLFFSKKKNINHEKQ